MKVLHAVLILISGLAINGCTSPTHVVRDESVSLSNYHTYMWVDTRENENDKSARPNAAADLSIRNAVNAELQKRGWREVTDNPNALVSHDVLVERNVESQNNPVYTRSFSRVYFNPYTRRWGTIYYPSRFAGYQTVNTPVREGTLTITIEDAKTDKTIWQGWTTKEVSRRRLSPKDVNSSVKSIFRKFKA